MSSSALHDAYVTLISLRDKLTRTVPLDPGAYSADALTAGNAAVTHEQFVVQKQDQTEELQGLPERRRGGQGTHPVVAPLKKQYIGFGNTNRDSRKQCSKPKRQQ